MIVNGSNIIDGVVVEVIRKRVRRISLRINADGVVKLTIPRWWATLAMGEEFLREKWKWVLKSRAEMLARPKETKEPVSEEGIAALKAVLTELVTEWTARLNEPNVTWKIRRVKSVWGSCHIRKRSLTFNAELSRVPRKYVEYVVVHELTHLKVSNHGPRFYALMDERLPAWKLLRRKLNRREFAENQDI